MIPISWLDGLILSHRLEAETAGQNTARIDDLYKRFLEFRGYVFRNIGNCVSGEAFLVALHCVEDGEQLSGDGDDGAFL